ncbi:hypothetical protein ACEPAI_2835 [Sanghuangporus weigelae]
MAWLQFLLAGVTFMMLGSTSLASSIVPREDSSIKACQLLQTAFPEIVSFPDSEHYKADNEHWAVTSTQNSTCSIEPETADDVSEILKIIGRPDIMSPFAIKGGGHAFNIGHSSTTGVQISMARFTGLTYDAERGTVTVGTGLTWDQVYSRLEPHSVMVVGGRFIGVGVAGLSLGGGYSWKTNQFGLTIDTIVSHSVVLPSGQQVVTSNATYTDLFFGLKGGLNNFGIVTNITYEVHSQTLVYGGPITYGLDAVDDLNVAICNFSDNNTDPKAQILPQYISASGQFSTVLMLFYDGPSVPNSLFDVFLSIPSISSDIKTRTFVDFVMASGNIDYGFDPFGTVQHAIPMTKYPKPLLNYMVQQTISFEDKLVNARGSEQSSRNVTVIMVPEPFLNPFSHSRGGAYHHPPSRQVTPGSPNFAYGIDPTWIPEEQSSFHDFAISSMKEFSLNIQVEAVAEGVSRWDDILYPNYALDGTPLELMYGSNVEKLQKVAAKYDPRGIMKLTGGPHF